jgi:tetratricopeptide (TPR) repeat protein
LSRRPIERYEWPLAAAILALAMSILIGERKRMRQTVRNSAFTQVATAAAALFLFCVPCALAAVPGLQLYEDGKYTDAYQSFLEDLKNNPDSPVKDKMQFDAGTAAYKMRDYNKALEAFSGSLLSRDKSLQADSHFNIGRTLEERADMDQAKEEALKDLVDAQSHYESVLQLDPANEAAKSNLEMVKKKIERLKHPPKEKPPTPTPTPPPPQKKNNNQDQENQQDQQQSSDKDQNQQQSQSGSGNGQNQKHDQGKDQAQAKNDQQKREQPKSGESPSPSPTAGKGEAKQPSPSPSAGQQKDQDKKSEKGEGKQPSPSPGETGSPSPSPETDKGEGEHATPTPAPSGSPRKKFAGDVKGAPGDKSEKPPDKNAEMVEAEQEKEGQMSERQAEALLQSMKDEEARVQLDERKATRRVYNDW